MVDLGEIGGGLEGTQRGLKMAGKRANRTDVAVGQRIRAFRKEANLSQTALADQIGVTFQQLQKYENGSNRVAAGRLAYIAHALDVPITAFFDGLARRLTDTQRTKSERLIELRAVPAALKLLVAFSKISDRVLEAELVNLVRALNATRGRK